MTSLDNLVLPCRHHHRGVHESGFGVERVGDGAIRFTRPGGRVIDAHPLLPAAGMEGWRESISSERDPPIDASNRIIAEGAMDLDPVGGLKQRRDTPTLPVG